MYRGDFLFFFLRIYRTVAATVVCRVVGEDTGLGDVLCCFREGEIPFEIRGGMVRAVEIVVVDDGVFVREGRGRVERSRESGGD